MSIRLAPFALVAAAALASAPFATAQDLSGTWTGGYVSNDQSDVNTFTVTLNAAGQTFTGTAFEVNRFGDASKAMFLTSLIQGTITPDGIVKFVKTYDGSGDIGHSVTYAGQLSDTGRRIQGTYDAAGTVGRFEMVR